MLGIAVFTGLASLSAYFRYDWAGKAGLALLMTLSVAGGLEAVRLVSGHAADLIGIGVASWEVWYGYGLNLIPLAVLIGCTTHVAGGMLTDSGCMLGYPVSRHRFHLLPEPLAFTTGTRPELLIVDPALSGALLVLAGWVADPAFVAAHWHSLTANACLLPYVLGRQLGQDLQGPDERGPVRGRQQREDPFVLLTLDGVAHGLAHAAARVGQRQQVDAPVGRVGPALAGKSFRRGAGLRR